VTARADLIERAAAAYRDLADLAETVEDEWQYVTDLTDAYLPSLEALATADSGWPLPAGAVEAVDEAIAEIALIVDPHRAIDWLSTFPHIVALALGGSVDEPAGAEMPGATEPEPEPDEPDEDSPFRMLLRRRDR
jgi:hypothetical protein